MKKSKSLFSTVLPAVLLMTVVFAAHAEENGFYIKNGRVLESSGSMFIARGINYAFAWFKSQLNSVIPAIANTGANCARVAVGSGQRWQTNESEIKSIIDICKKNKLIAILEVHDCTGYPEQSGSVPLSTAVNFWKSMKNALVGQEKYVWINIGNEPFGNNAAAADWVNEHKKAIQDLRSAGFEHLLVCDAANWGQDYTNTTSSRYSLVLEADTKNRTLISVHMYDVFKTDDIINTYMKKFVDKGNPLLVGEFASDHGSGKPIDEAAIMKRAKQYDIGYCGWSWCGNGSGLGSLDIASGCNAGSWTEWGRALIDGENGIKKTSKIAHIFGGAFVDPPTTEVVKPPVASASAGIRVTGAGSFLNVSFLSGSPDGSAQIGLFDLKGQLVRSAAPALQASGPADYSISTTGLPAGSYLVRCVAAHAVMQAGAVVTR